MERKTAEKWGTILVALNILALIALVVIVAIQES